MDSQFYTIDASSLCKAARKPKHLEKRLANRAKTITDIELGVARREAFLNARRQKLNQRTSQIEKAVTKVREMQNSKKSEIQNLIESTINKAAENRSRLLQKSIEFHANCVKRAKHVAKIQTRKTLEESLALQKQIDTRMRVTAIRRERLLAFPRQSVTEADKLSLQDAAALKIQNYYRVRKFTPLVKIYKKVGLTRDHAKQFSFEDLLTRVQNPTTLKVISYFLVRAKRINGSKAMYKTAGKVYLSALVFVTYPNEVLLKMDDQEQDLLENSEKLVTDFTNWIETTRSDLIAPLSKQFLATFDSFYHALEAYKSRDKIAFVNQLIGHFIELDKLWLNVIDRDDAFTAWAGHVEEQQNMHLKRILKFGETAQASLKAAREEFKQFAREQGIEMKVAEDKPFTTTAHLYYMPLEKMQVDEVKENQSNGLPKEDLSTFGTLLSNEQLAHELVMDPKFELKKDVKSQLELQVAEVAKKAMADMLRNEINNGNYSNGVLELLMEIKQGLLAMLNEKGAIASEIEQVLEHDYLIHQMRNNVFDLYKTASYIGEKMLQLCAPVRDASIRALKDEQDIVLVLMKIMDIIEDMRLDLANFRLSTIRPQLMQQAVEYEKQKFNDALASNKISLTQTKVWLVSTWKDMQEKADSRNPEQVDTETNIKLETLFNQAVLSMLFATEPMNPTNVPETFVLDQKRLFDFQNELQAMNIVSALVMLSMNIVPQFRAEEQVVRQMTIDLLALLKEQDTIVKTLADKIIDTANEMFHRQTKVTANLSNLTSNPTQQILKEVSDDQKEMIHNMAEKMLSFKDPFFNLISRRLEKVVRQSLENTFKPDSLVKHGLGFVAPEITELLVKIALLVKHNKNVYGEHYNTILKSLME